MQNLVEKLLVKWPLGKLKKQNNVNLEVRYIRYEDREWMELT
jgi:hypothetical protein